jgi:hypothetical protein
MSRLVRGACVVTALGLHALALAPRATAQPAPNGSAATAPQADSAQQARAAYRRAVGAFRQRDLPTARQEMQRAAELWPMQQVYLESAAGLAAMARDTGDATRWIAKLAELGVGGGVATDTTYRALVGAGSFDAAAARLTAATAPVPRSRVRLTIPDTMFHAEGIAFDARSGRWFVGSVRQRRIVAVGRDGNVTDFARAGADGLAGCRGSRRATVDASAFSAIRWRPAGSSEAPGCLATRRPLTRLATSRSLRTATSTCRTVSRRGSIACRWAATRSSRS